MQQGSTSRKFTLLFLALALTLGFSSLLIGADKKKKTSEPAAKSTAAPMAEEKRALHVLNRLAFGPRPGDIERVTKIGVDPWIEQQLHPSGIDNAALAARLAPLRTLSMSTREIVESFPPPQVIRAIAEGKMAMPSDPAKRELYLSAVARYQQVREQKADTSTQAGSQQSPQQGQSQEMDDPTKPKRQQQLEDRMYAELKGQEILDLPPEQRYDAIMKLAPNDRRMLEASLKGEDRQQMLSQLSPQQRETLMALNNPQQVVAVELQEGKALRAVYSERQLEEVMTDFWFNHFNVFINKGPERYMISAYERDVIRPRVFGKFKDLLMATAESPAMLFYLDNWQSVGPDSDIAQGRKPANGGFNRRGRFKRQNQAKRPQQQQQRRGLNENYAREIMELHTLGVDGGYTQKDVTELAKILTGWTIREPQRGGDFEFNERMHQPGKKTLLGKTFKEDGQREGERAIEMLAKHPSTAQFISRKLAMRFVSDDPPQALVDRMAQTFLKTDGDIREVLRTLFRSPEFWAADSYRAKVKTPFEFVVSSLRATNADVADAMPTTQTLNRMGMPLYGMQPPTGYSMKKETWVNSAALLDRMNFALSLGSGRMNGVQVNPQGIFNGATPQDAAGAQAALEQVLLAGDVSVQTRQTISQQLNDPQVTGRQLDDPARMPNAGVIAGLILGSPEFQRR